MLAVACLAMAAATTQTYRLSGAKAANAALALSLAAERETTRIASEAAAVHRAHIERLQRSEADWRGLNSELQAMEGRDAPLSDHMRAAAKRLWP